MASETDKKQRQDEYDNRYFPRWEVSNELTYTFDKASELKIGKTLDLSCSGACIVVNEDMNIGQALKMRITLASDVYVTLKGEVIWKKFIDGKHHLGISFASVSNKAQDLILQHAFELNKEGVIKHWYKGWDGSG